MSAPSDPHDKLFRALLDDPQRAAGLLRQHLPAEIVAELADAPPEPLEGGFIDDALRGSRSDGLFRVALKDGTSAYIYTLLEHKSTPDPRTPVQLLGYMARIWDRHLAACRGTPDTLPAIIPLVIYHGRVPWTPRRSVLDWIAAPPAILVPARQLRYIIRELGRLDDAELAQEPVLWAGLMALKHVFDQGLAPDFVASFLAETPDGSMIELQLLEYVVRGYEVGERDLEAALTRAKPHRWEELLGTVAEEWLKRGEARGEARGRAEGRADSVLRILRQRFGEPDPDLAARVRTADLATLECMLDRALTVSRPADILDAEARS